MRKREMFKKLLAGLLTIMLVVSVIPQDLTRSEVRAAVTLQNPRIVTDSSMNAGQKVTYDCVWFGSYPQTEIVDQASTSGVYGKPWAKNTDYQENPSLYTTLKNASGWNSNGDITISGTKYRRIKSSEATYTLSSDGYYNWSSTDTFHYFRYEPVKWRVLNVSESKVFLVADVALDDQRYNSVPESTTWKTSTIRSWLNGYDSSTNSCGEDYTGKNFINSAFTSTERSAIVATYLDNKTTGPNCEEFGGDNTTDKVFLLSNYDVYNSLASGSYGFYKPSYAIYDEARRKSSSTFAKAMGVWTSTDSASLGNCSCWLRSPGGAAYYAGFVSDNGYVSFNGLYVDNLNRGVSPAIYLNLSSGNLYSYAGTVCSDGTVNEVKKEVTKKTQVITALNKSIAINSKPVSLGAKTNGNGKITYSSSAPSVATISALGVISPKNYGTTTIMIKAAETSTYKPTSKKITVTVVPKKMTLTTVKSPAKKTLLIKWKKDPAATKYEIQLCMKSNFKKNTLSRTYGKKVVKQKIKNMKSKNWYVRIRAWKKVGGKTYYGIWSNVKKVKVK